MLRLFFIAAATMLSACANDPENCHYRVHAVKWDAQNGHVNNPDVFDEIVDRVSIDPDNLVFEYYTVEDNIFMKASCGAIPDILQGLEGVVIIGINEQQYMGLVET